MKSSEFFNRFVCFFTEFNLLRIELDLICIGKSNIAIEKLLWSFGTHISSGFDMIIGNARVTKSGTIDACWKIKMFIQNWNLLSIPKILFTSMELLGTENIQFFTFLGESTWFCSLWWIHFWTILFFRSNCRDFFPYLLHEQTDVFSNTKLMFWSASDHLRRKDKTQFYLIPEDENKTEIKLSFVFLLKIVTW